MVRRERDARTLEAAHEEAMESELRSMARERKETRSVWSSATLAQGLGDPVLYKGATREVVQKISLVFRLANSSK